MKKYDVFFGLGRDKHLKDVQNICKISFGRKCGAQNFRRLLTAFCGSKSEDPGILFLSFQADGKGCFTQLVQTKIFQLRQKGYDMTIQVEAKVKEEGTGWHCF